MVLERVGEAPPVMVEILIESNPRFLDDDPYDLHSSADELYETKHTPDSYFSFRFVSFHYPR